MTMYSAPDPAGDSLIFRFVQWAGAAMGGALVTLVAFRTRLALMDRRIDDRKAEIDREIADRKAEIEALERRNSEHLERMDRRSIEQLRMTADIARKVGVDNRFTDAVLRMLADETGGDRDG